MSDTNIDWLPAFKKFIKFLKIQSKDAPSGLDGAGADLNLYGSQMRFLEEMAAGLAEGVRIFYCLKSRQLGVTTISLAIDVFFLAMFPGTRAALIVDESRNAESFRRIVELYVKSFPDGFFGGKFDILKNNRVGITFSNNSQLDFLVAGLRDRESFGDGGGYSLAHFCAAPGTPVIIEDGRIVPIEEVKIGARVLTHTGALTTVVDAFGQPNKKGPMIRIQPWLGDAVTCSLDHTIPTQRGTIEAKDLRPDDLLVMPVRRIKQVAIYVSLPPARMEDYAAAGKTRRRRVNPVGAGSFFPLIEDTGFAVGYYLAEGSIEKAGNGRPTGLIFTRHRDEAAYSDRAVAALAPFLTPSRNTKDRPNSLTSQVSVYGSALAQWVFDTFGEKEDKHIPDRVFTWGEDFCRGLLAGLLAGDGSKTRTSAQKYATNTMILPTTRASLAMQLRDIAAALGYGWASCRYAAGGVKYGRNCKPIWRLTWCGDAAAKLRALLGLEVYPQNTKGQAQKYRIENGLVYIKIKTLERGVDVPYMWDLSVEHSDHTFRTPSMSIGNTEVGRYGCPNALLSFRNALSEHNPNRLYIYESRAEGPNHWKDMWEDAADNPYLIRRFFIGWWSRADQRIPKSNPRFTQYGTYPPNEEERTLIAQVRESYGFTVDMEQLAWYRERANAKDMTIESMHAQQPWTEAQAFVTSGFSYFPIRMLQQDWDAITDWDTGPQFLPFEYIMGDSFFDTQIRQMGEEDPEQRWQLRVWENPVRGAKYVIGMDPAYGRNDWKDNHSISVWRCFSDKLVQVAEYAWADDLTRHATWVLAHLAGNYEDCIINLEITGPGAVVMQELDSLRAELRKEAHTQMSQDRNFGNFLTAARWYLYQRPDSMGKGYVYNTKTGFESKRRVLQRMKDDYFSRAMLIRSKPLIEEMMSVKQDNNEIGAPGRGKDDRVMAAAFAVSAWREWVQPGMLAMNMTYEDTMRREAGEVDTGADTVGNMVRNYLKRVEAEADEPPPETWAQARGFS